MSGSSASLLAQLAASSQGSLLPRVMAARGLEQALGAASFSLRHIATSTAWRMAAAQPQEQTTQPGASSGRVDSAKTEAQQPGNGASSSSSASAAGDTGQAGASTSGPEIPGVDAEAVKQRVYSAFKAGFDTVRSNVGAGAGAGGGGGNGSGGGPQPPSHSVLQMVAKEVLDVFRPADNHWSATRKYTGPVMEFSEGSAGTTALQVVRQQQSTWQRMQDRLWDLPLLSRLRGFRVADTSAYKKGQEVVDDLKDKYETSDHPMVHKVDEFKERVMSGSESSQAMREVRTRDPHFDLNTFVRAIKADAPVVVRALLRRDLDTLSLHVGPEMMERLAGIFKHEEERGHEDPAILFVSDVELVEVRSMDGDPFVVAQFHCQQLKCVRDKFGNVVDGSPDSIQRVYYFWGLQQEKAGVVTADGVLLPPRWVIRDMMWQSMLALV